MTGVNSGSLL